MSAILTIIAGEESKSEKHEHQKSSFNLVNLATGIATLGLVDTGAIYTNEVHNKDNYDTTAKSSSIKAGGNIVAETGTTNIVGSDFFFVFCVCFFGLCFFVFLLCVCFLCVCFWVLFGFGGIFLLFVCFSLVGE